MGLELRDNPLGATDAPVGNLAGIPTMEWVRLRQPYIDDRGRACVSALRRDRYGRALSINDARAYSKNDSTGGAKARLTQNYLINDLRNMGVQLPSVCNAATLTKLQWTHLDQQVVREYRQPLVAWSDLLSGPPVVGGFDAYGKRNYEYIAVSDPGYAYVDMDAETDGTVDTQANVIRSVPLPITHCDNGFTDRELATSQQGPVPLPLDIEGREWGGQRVAEAIEDQVIGNVTGPTWGTRSGDAAVAHDGTSTVYGYLTYAQRLTKTNMTTPTGSNADTTFSEVNAALQTLITQRSYGPFMMYHSLDWEQYMNGVFSVSGGNHPGETLRSMLLKIPRLSGVKLLPRLTSTFTLVIVDMSGKTVRAINGRDVYVVQWDLKGGLQHRLKTLAIQVPVFYHDYSDRTGVLVATTS